MSPSPEQKGIIAIRELATQLQEANAQQDTKMYLTILTRIEQVTLSTRRAMSFRVVDLSQDED